MRRFRCIKLIREPTQADWKAFLLHSSYHGLEEPDSEEQTRQAPLDDDEDDSADATQYVDEENVPVRDLQAVRRPIPQWTPEQPITNFIFNLVSHAGEKGLSTMVC